jgi:hypothetical protein
VARISHAVVRSATEGVAVKGLDSPLSPLRNRRGTNRVPFPSLTSALFALLALSRRATAAKRTTRTVPMHPILVRIG